MKSPLFSVFIVASVVIAVAHSLPRAQREREHFSEENSGVDTVLVMPNGKNSFVVPRPVFPDLDDDDSLTGFNPFRMNFNPFRSNPMEGFLNGIQRIMDTMKEQMTSVMSGMPGPGAFVPWGKIPEGGNTTSTTKIIAGHVVTVNETTYQNGDDNSNTFYRIRLVDVKPLNETADGSDETEEVGIGEDIETIASGNAATTGSPPEKEETTTQARSVETVEDFADNKIPDNRQDDGLTA